MLRSHRSRTEFDEHDAPQVPSPNDFGQRGGPLLGKGTAISSTGMHEVTPAIAKVATTPSATFANEAILRVVYLYLYSCPAGGTATPARPMHPALKQQ